MLYRKKKKGIYLNNSILPVSKEASLGHPSETLTFIKEVDDTGVLCYAWMSLWYVIACVETILLRLSWAPASAFLLQCK